MNIYDELKSEAYAKIKFITEQCKAKEMDELAIFGMLFGVEGFAVKANRDAPNNYQAIIDAVHECYRDNIELQKTLKKYYQLAFIEMVDNCGHMEGYSDAINILYYEMLVEKKGQASFNIDFNKILRKFKANLEDGYKDMKKENHHFDEWIKEKNDFIKSNFGYSFWDK